MKRFNLIIAIAISTIMFTACEKEESSPVNNTPTQNTKEKSNLNHNKSNYEYNIDTMAMAANIETIGASSNGDYSITLYNNSNTYTVNINAFDEEVLIDMDITDPMNGTHNIVIDPQAETISVGNIGDYTFQQYENYVISPSENTIKNIMAIMTVYHAIYPDFSKTFDDNGDEDEFDPNPDSELKFWGKNYTYMHTAGGINGGPCYKTYMVQKSRFWSKHGKPYAWTDYKNPVPCE